MRKATIATTARVASVILAAATTFTSMNMAVLADEVDSSMESSVSEDSGSEDGDSGNEDSGSEDYGNEDSGNEDNGNEDYGYENFGYEESENKDYEYENEEPHCGNDFGVFIGPVYVETHNEPEAPEIPPVPETPETPVIPETPTDPGTPETPETPADPGTPETPETPTDPGTPETPTDPGTPETPETPETTTDPGTPVTPETTTDSGTPVTPETTTDSGTPVTPETTTDSGTPVTPETNNNNNEKKSCLTEEDKGSEEIFNYIISSRKFGAPEDQTVSRISKQCSKEFLTGVQMYLSCLEVDVMNGVNDSLSTEDLEYAKDIVRQAQKYEESGKSEAGTSTENKETGKNETGTSTENKETGKTQDDSSTENKETGKTQDGSSTENKETGKTQNGTSTENKETGKTQDGSSTENKETAKNDTGKDDKKEEEKSGFDTVLDTVDKISDSVGKVSDTTGKVCDAVKKVRETMTDSVTGAISDVVKKASPEELTGLANTLGSMKTAITNSNSPDKEEALGELNTLIGQINALRGTTGNNTTTPKPNQDNSVKSDTSKTNVTVENVEMLTKSQFVALTTELDNNGWTKENNDGSVYTRQNADGSVSRITVKTIYSSEDRALSRTFNNNKDAENWLNEQGLTDSNIHVHDVYVTKKSGGVFGFLQSESKERVSSTYTVTGKKSVAKVTYQITQTTETKNA